MADLLTEPLLTEERARGGDGIAGKVLSATVTLNRGVSYARQRTFLRHGGGKDPDDVDRPSFLSRALAPFKKFITRFKEELNYAALPAKAGLSAAVCSILCFVPGPLSVLNKNGVWAVVTADVVLETTVGLTLSKGINRTLGTLTASAVALLVNYTAPMCGRYEPYFVICFVFLSAALATMFKFRRPFKDRWNYAVAMSMITFHILILSKSEYKDKIRLPIIRLITITMGFLTASLLNMAVSPNYCGSTINELVAKNFERAGNVMERCVTAYSEGTVLYQVSDILAGKSEDDNIHMSFHEIISADSEVDKLMKAVHFEPCHGKFFFGYPWDLYEDIKDNLRYTLYDVVALDSCLRAEIQAPMHLRRIFEEEFQCIGKRCAQVFRVLGHSIRSMRHIHCLEDMQRAEEGALLLQHKIAKYTTTLLGGGHSDPETAAEAELNDTISSCFDDAYEDRSLPVSQSDLSHLIIEYASCLPTPRMLRQYIFSCFKLSRQYIFSCFKPHREDTDSTKPSKDFVKSHSGSRAVSDHAAFMQRQESLNRNWDTTVKRISALSLIKFASLLIELVAKAKYVVSIVDELEERARFEDCEDGERSTLETEKAGYLQV